MAITMEAPRGIETGIIPDTQVPEQRYTPYPAADRLGPEAWRWVNKTGVIVLEPSPVVETRDPVAPLYQPRSQFGPEIVKAMNPNPKI